MEMSKYCPITKKKVTYMFCQECDEKYKCRTESLKNKNKDKTKARPC